MNDSTRRTLRGAVQVILGVLVSLGAVLLIPGINDSMDNAGLGKAFGIFSLIVLVLTTFFTKLQNYLEDNTKFPALLKAPASQGVNPTPDPLKNPKV